ncbi:MAG TPA: cell division protein ZapA [Sphingomonas sp.]
MAQVTLTIGGRQHAVGCRDGEEDRLRLLGKLIEARWPTALRAAGNQPGERAMLIVALMLADALDEAEHRPVATSPIPSVDDAALARIADRLEGLADALERTPEAS